MQLPKNIQAQIENMEQRRAIEARDERTKRQITENQDAIEFWIATARHWQKRASFLEGVAQREKDTATHAVTEMQAQAMERDHWKRAAEQNHGDVMAAERRTDAMGDILDALARGWIMEPFDGCAKWWRHDTDTLAAIAKAAREWEQAEDNKPTDAKGQPLDPITEVVNITPADGEEFQIGSTLYQHAEPCDCQAYPILGHELPHETQSGHNRLAQATNLIMQLSNDHDGRNTWLMNFAENKDPAVQAMIRRQPRQCFGIKHVTDMVAQQPEEVKSALACDPNGERWIVWEWGYKPADVAETDTVEIKTIADLRNVLEASAIDWEQVTAYRVIRANPIATASPVADAGAVMAEVSQAVAKNPDVDAEHNRAAE